MNNEERDERPSITRTSTGETRDNDRTPRPSISREESSTSQRFQERFSRFERPRSRTVNNDDHERTRLLTRDFAEHEPQQKLRSVRSTAISFRQPSIHRQLRGTLPSGSPGPAYSWRFMDSDRRSVAIASGRDWDTASRKFSMAGPAPMDTLAANQPYIDPGYAQLNPAYDQPANVRPVWSLAKPLPHVLRPGMVPTKEELYKEVSQRDDRAASVVDLEAGRIEPSLRPGKMSAQLDDVRREREIGLLDTFQQQRAESPGMSPFARSHRESPARKRIPDLHVDDPIPEDEEYRHQPSDPGMDNLSESISKINRTKRLEHEAQLPYEDVIPLLAYQAETDEVHNLHTYWSVVRLQFREPLAEMLGIFVLYTIGFSSSLVMTVSRGAAGVNDTPDWAWGFAVMIAIYIAGGVSGAHFNPAISMMLYIYRGFPLSKIPKFLPAQFIGAMLATLVSFTIFRPGLLAVQSQELLAQGSSNVIDASTMPDASLVLGNFLGFPRQPWVDTRTAFLTESVATALLAVSVLALGDDSNAPPGAGMNAFIVGLLIVALGMAFGYNTGLMMNPVRDFGPRVALTMLGYGSDPYPSLFADGYWFKVNWLAPFTGTILGGFIYDSMIFTGGESPINYPPERIRRAAKKWVGRWQARVGRTKIKLNEIKDEVVES